MTFDAFRSAIEEPSLRAVAAHWNEARGQRLLPAWGDIDPAAIARHLPIVWAWRYDPATDAFTGRLSGEEINNAFGKSLRGVAMNEFFKNWDYEKIFQRHRRVVTEPCVAHGLGAVFIHAERYGDGERIIMPLADDGVHGDGIMGATVYRAFRRTGERDLDELRERVEYYSLGAPTREP